MTYRPAILICTMLIASIAFSIGAEKDIEANVESDILHTQDMVLTDAREAAGWSLSAGGFEDENLRGYDVAPDGSLFIVGTFTSSMMYGDSGMQAVGMQYDEDFFIGKISSSGDWEWMISGGSEGADNANDISVDPRDGSAYVTGAYCLGTAGNSCSMQLGSLAELGKNSDEDEGNGWIGRISSDGNWQWAKRFGTNMDDQGLSVVNDGNGTIYHSGLFLNMITIGSDTLPGTDAYSIFMAKMDDSGAWEWAKAGVGPVGIEPFGGACIDSQGQPWFAGTFTDNAMFDETILISMGAADAYLVRLNTTGEFDILLSAGGVGDDWGYGCAVDESDGAIIVGNFEGNMSAGDMNVSSNGWLDAFIASADSEGVWQSISSFGGSGYEIARSVSITPNGERIVVGSMSGTVNVGEHTLTSNGNSDAMVISMNANDSVNWALNVGGTGEEVANGVMIGGGSPIIVGNFQNTVDFKGNSNTSEGMNDFFIWQYAKDFDGDGIVDGSDNCPETANPSQTDHDLDGEGDACEDDTDGDGLIDDLDDCAIGSIGWTSNNETDYDSDGCHDYSEDLDDDQDGIPDENDSCSKGPLGWISTLEEDIDSDGCADIDTDGDGLVDQSDNCPQVINADQLDDDGDGIGDACDGDADGDGITTEFDDCPTGETNWDASEENDNDGDGCKDSTEDTDDDGDGVADFLDDCPTGEIGWSSADPGEDHDNDGCRDSMEDSDDDGDGFLDSNDACPTGAIGHSPLGQDIDNDGCNDISEDDDLDNDGVVNSADNCPLTPTGVDTDVSGCSDSQRDSDGDGVLDTVDQCPDTPSGTSVTAATGCATSPGTGGGNSGGTIVDEKSSGGGLLDIDPVLLYGGGAVALLAVIAIIVTMIGNKPPPRRDADDEFGMHLDSSMDVHIQTSLGETASQQDSSIGGFTDEQLMSAGWTPEQIAAHRQR